MQLFGVAPCEIKLLKPRTNIDIIVRTTSLSTVYIIFVVLWKFILKSSQNENDLLLPMSTISTVHYE